MSTLDGATVEFGMAIWIGRTVACTCQVCVACTCRVSVACTCSVSMYAWDSQQLAGSKVVRSRDHVVQRKKFLLKLRICRWSEVVGGDQFSSRRSKYVITPPTPPTPPYPPTTRRLVCVQVQGTLSSHPPHPTTRRLVCLQVQGTISSHPPHPTHPTHPTTSVDYYVCKSKYVTIPPTHPTLPTHHPHSSMCASPRNVIIPPTPPTPPKKCVHVQVM